MYIAVLYRFFVVFVHVLFSVVVQNVNFICFISLLISFVNLIKRKSVLGQTTEACISLGILHIVILHGSL